MWIKFIDNKAVRCAYRSQNDDRDADQTPQQ